MGTPRFSLGRTTATQGALAELSMEEVLRALARHAKGTWGDLSEDDRQANELALEHGDRLLSAYHSVTGVKFWVITEWDRSSTTVLLPEEY